MSRLKWRAETGFLIGLFLGLIAAGRSQMFADPGCLWHPVTGEIVLRQGFFHGDPFGYREYKDWFAKDWLAEVTLAMAHRWGGPDLMLLVPAATLAAFYTWIFHCFLRAGCHWMLALLLTLIAIACSSFHFFARPLIFTLVLLGWTFGRMCDVEGGRRGLRSLWAIVPAIVLWANLHPGVIGGIGTVGLVAGGWIVAWLLRFPTPVRNWRDALLVAVWTVACCLAMLVNPFGFDLVRLSFNLVASPLLPLLIDEHRRLSFTNPDATEASLLLFAAVYIAFLAALLPTKPRVTWVVSLVWLGLAVARIRNGELFVTTAIIIVADWLPKHPWAQRLARRGDWYAEPRETPPQRERISFMSLTPAIFVFAVVVALKVERVPIPVVGYGWARLATNIAPVEVLPELREYELTAPMGKPIFNDMNFGGFVIYFLPRLRVFIDDRCELYGDAGLIEYVKVNQDPTWIDRYADQYGFDLALVAVDTPKKASPFDKYLRDSPRWQLVKRGEIAAVYRRVK